MSDFIVKIFLKVAVGCSGAGGKKGKLFCGFWSVRWARATHKCAYPCALGCLQLRDGTINLAVRYFLFAVDYFLFAVSYFLFAVRYFLFAVGYF